MRTIRTMYVASGRRVFTDAMCKWGGDVFLRFTADTARRVPTKKSEGASSKHPRYLYKNR